jgi:hypothetical protein
MIDCKLTLTLTVNHEKAKEKTKKDSDSIEDDTKEGHEKARLLRLSMKGLKLGS